MICPKCMVQMCQKETIGGCNSSDDMYETWEVKYCPVCKRNTLEFYSAVVLSDSVVEKLKTKNAKLVIEIL